MASVKMAVWGVALLLVGCADDAGEDEGGQATGGTSSTGDVATGDTAGEDGVDDDGPDSTSSTGMPEDEGSDDEPSETGDTGDPPLPGEAPLEGYGTTSPFGERGETCVVTTLDDSGPGSLRDCIENRDTTDDNPTPRVVTFDVGGTIEPLTDIRIRQPFLTVDGLSAPDPGITIAKSGTGEDGEFIINTWSANATCGHDVLVQGIRFVGVWEGIDEMHSQNAATIAIDGEDLPLCLHHVVLNRITVRGAQDSGGDIWGSARDVTVQYSAFLESLHPNTYSHFPGGVPDQQRERFSNHHNLYGWIHERGPQVRGDNRDMNFEQNIMHRWGDYGFGGGYAMRLRCRDAACPQRINLIANHFTGAAANLETGLILGEAAGDDPDGTTVEPQVYMADNWLPPENLDAGTAASEFPRDPEADVTLFAPGDVVDSVLPNIGAPYRTAEEDALFAEVAAQIETDQG